MKEHREEQASTVFCGTKGPCAPDAMTMVSTVWPVVGKGRRSREAFTSGPGMIVASATGAQA